MPDNEPVRRKKRTKQPTQHDPRGIPTLLVGKNGKKRMVWSSELQGLSAK